MTTTEALIRAGQAYMAAACSGNLAGAVDAMRAALAQQPAASGEPAIHWPQVIAYKGGNGGLGAWIDVSTGDGPECVTRYFAAQPAPARVPFTQAQLRRLYDNRPEIGNHVRSRYGFYRVAMLVEAAHGIAAAPTAQQEPARAEGEP